MYKVRCRHRKFKSSNAILSISIGNPSSEGEKLSSIVRWINQNFSDCTVLLADSVNRHNNYWAHKAPEKFLWWWANIGGAEWIKRNNEILEKFTIPYKISRWDDYLLHPDYEDAYNFVMTLYNQPRFYKTINEDAQRFLERNQKQAKDMGLEEVVIEQSKKYILEELAVEVLLARQDRAEWIYPGEALKSILLIRDRLVSPVVTTQITLLRDKQERLVA